MERYRARTPSCHVSRAALASATTYVLLGKLCCLLTHTCACILGPLHCGYPACVRRYDVGVLTGCKSDIDDYCREERMMLRGNATVLKCLVENFDKTSE